MCPTEHGSGPELEKFPDAPPSIAIIAPEDVPDAGLRSLDHCKYSLGIQLISTNILVVQHLEGAVLLSLQMKSFGKSRFRDLLMGLESRDFWLLLIGVFRTASVARFLC